MRIEKTGCWSSRHLYSRDMHWCLGRIGNDAVREANCGSEEPLPRVEASSLARTLCHFSQLKHSLQARGPRVCVPQNLSLANWYCGKFLAQGNNVTLAKAAEWDLRQAQ